ncbi:MAG: hypothetical protein ACOYNC_04915 [Bacteroidales bacterium]
MPPRPRLKNPGNGPHSGKAIFELSLLSTFLFIFSALLLQFLLNLHSALLLAAYDITYQYSLFAISYLTETATVPEPSGYLAAGSSKWSEDKLYFIFATGPMVLTSLGFLLLFGLRKLRNLPWKIRLFLTWMAFLMVNALPCGLIAGVFFYDGFGIAFQWLIPSYIVRLIIALMVLLLLIFFSRFWQRMFLKASYTSAFTDSVAHQRKFILNVFFKPWIYGFFILLLFNWPFNNLFWRTFLLSFAYMAIALFDHNIRVHRRPHIHRTDKNIFTSRLQPLWFALALVGVWVADYFLIF